jgi:hypothetical protein
MRPVGTTAGITRSRAARVIHQTGQALHGVNEFHSRREWASPWWLPRGSCKSFLPDGFRPGCGIEYRDEGSCIR